MAAAPFFVKTPTPVRPHATTLLPQVHFVILEMFMSLNLKRRRGRNLSSNFMFLIPTSNLIITTVIEIRCSSIRKRRKL